MAVREWSLRSKKAKAALDRVDAERLDYFEQLFRAFGYGPHEALIRARVCYYHQVGYYTLAVKETKTRRYENSDMYMKILAGERFNAPAR